MPRPCSVLAEPAQRAGYEGVLAKPAGEPLGKGI